MPRVKNAVHFGFVLLFMFFAALVTSKQALHAQSQNPPSAGTIEVKVPQAIDSDRDASGKEYAATVTQTVNAGGTTIVQGSLARVTLVKAADGTASVQLVAINMPSQGRVAASSSSVTVTGSPVQKATSRLGSALGSRLGGIAQSAAAPAVTPTASGARVFLPPGSTLQFAFSMGSATPPAAAATPVAAAPVAVATTPSAPPTANTVPSPVAASGNSASGQLNAMEICFATTRDPASGQGTMYLTAAFEVPVGTLSAVPVFEPAFSAYLKATYQYTGGITCQPIWAISDVQPVQKKLTDLRDSGKMKVINTGWRYGQSAAAQGQSGFDPLAQGPGGVDLSQHRLTTYFCTFTAAGGTTVVKPPGPMDETAYVSPIFQADWDSAPVNKAWVFYIRDHYVHDLNLSDLSPKCGAESPALQASMHQGAGVSKFIGHKIPVDWTYTPAQAAEAKTAEAAEAAHTAAEQAPTAAANQNYVWCHSAWGGTAGTVMPVGTVMYFSDIFPADMPPPLKPTPGHPLPPNANGAQINRRSALQASFFALIQKKYGYKDSGNYPVDCSIGDPPTVAGLQNAQKNKQQFEDLAKQNRGQIVETGWKNE